MTNMLSLPTYPAYTPCYPMLEAIPSNKKMHLLMVKLSRVGLLCSLSTTVACCSSKQQAGLQSALRTLGQEEEAESSHKPLKQT